MLANGEEAGKAKAVCSNCGGELKEDGTCSICGTRHDLKGETAVSVDSDKAFLEEVSGIPGLGPAKAEALLKSGYQSMDQLREASLEDLGAIEGFGEKLAEKVHEHLQATEAPEVPEESPEEEEGEDRGKEALEKWLKGEESFESWLEPEGSHARKADAPLSKAARSEEESPVATEEMSPQGVLRPKGREESTEALKRWLKGDEEGLEAWLSEPTIPAAEIEAPLVEVPEENVQALKAELAELKRAMKEDLGKEGGFNPIKYLEQIAKLNEELRQEVQRRKEVASELDHLKKSSVAVIKYVKTQKGEEAPEAQRKLVEERESRKKLEIELEKVQSLLEQARQELQSGLKNIPEDQRPLKEAELRLKERETELEAKEKQLRVAEEELAAETASWNIACRRSSPRKSEISLRKKPRCRRRSSSSRAKLTD